MSRVLAAICLVLLTASGLDAADCCVAGQSDCSICKSFGIFSLNPPNCTTGATMQGVGLQGTAECAVPATVPALAANGTNCTGTNEFAKGMDAELDAEGCVVPPQLAAAGTACAANEFIQGIDTGFNRQGCAIPSRLATNGTNCTGNEFLTGADETSNAEGCAVPATLATNQANCAAHRKPVGVDATFLGEGCAIPRAVPLHTSLEPLVVNTPTFWYMGKNATAASIATVAPTGGTASTLFCNLSATVNATCTATLKLQNLDPAADLLTCTITLLATTCTTAGPSAAFDAGDRLVFGWTTAGLGCSTLPPTVNGSCSVNVNPA